MGLLSKSLVKTVVKEHLWQVPDGYYQAIVQQMVILNKAPLNAHHSQSVRSFYQYILSPQGQDIISQNGYLLPTASATTEDFTSAR